MIHGYRPLFAASQPPLPANNRHPAAKGACPLERIISIAQRHPTAKCTISGDEWVVLLQPGRGLRSPTRTRTRTGRWRLHLDSGGMAGIAWNGPAIVRRRSGCAASCKR